ncbi:MAG: hypothetical protein KC619_16905 [Myxococcales bacterium]|nr:hypothetical protein [Myxococcales bacterium]
MSEAWARALETLEEVERTTREALEAIELHRAEDPVDVFFTGFGGSSVDLVARIWIDFRKQRDFAEAQHMQAKTEGPSPPPSDGSTEAEAISTTRTTGRQGSCRGVNLSCVTLQATVEELCAAVDGANWDPVAIDTRMKRMLALCAGASQAELDAALAVVAARVGRSRTEDGDGVAFAAISGGSLVEQGAHPRPLAEALLERLPEVLERARAFADRFRPTAGDPWAGVDPARVITEVDGFPIPHEAFVRELPHDRAGGCSLAYLRQWVLPTTAVFTRDLEMLARAQRDERLARAVSALRRSEAHWLEPLMATQLARPWIALDLEADRAFELEVDQVAANAELNAVVSAAVLARRPRKGRSPPVNPQAAFDLYTRAALPFLVAGEPVPPEHRVSLDGLPTDVPADDDGRRRIVLGPATVHRAWVGSPVFSALRPSARVVRALRKRERDRL